MLQNIRVFVFRLKIGQLIFPEHQQGYKVAMWSCSTFKQEHEVRSTLQMLLNASQIPAIQILFFTLVIFQVLQSIIVCHSKNVNMSLKLSKRFYFTYTAERTSSSVRSLFSKGTGLWREGACVCVLRQIPTGCFVCVYVCASECKQMNQSARESILHMD